MAMTRCAECGYEISTSARACPKCGAVVPRRKLWPWVIGIPLALSAVFLLWGASIPEYESRALEERKMCEQLAPYQKDERRRIYDKAIRDGKATAAR